jgi:RNA polymerase sigma factor (sigma-70 family)
MSEATSIRVQRAVAGDRESLGWIVAHFDPFVIAQVRMRLGAAGPQGDEVRDVVDEIWLALLGRIGDLRPREGRMTPVLLKFLTTASFNVCNNFLRRAITDRARRRPGAVGEPRPGAATPQPTIAEVAARQTGVATRASWREIGARIGTALDSLDPDKVEILVLRLVEQRTNVEIAGLLGIPRNTVAVRYRRALEKLRASVPASIFADVLALRRS